MEQQGGSGSEIGVERGSSLQGIESWIPIHRDRHIFRHQHLEWV